jgi:Tol biopolymer transport system component
MFRVLRAVSLLLLLLIPLAACSGESRGQMREVSVSPDGKFIALVYVKDGTSFIYRIASDTGNATRLTDAKTGAESSPSFSSDGKQIAYSYSPGNGAHSRIVIGNADGSGSHPWATSETDDFRPVFLPDNKHIVFARSGYYGSYSPIAQPHQHEWNFFESDLDGKNVRQLTNESFYMVSPAAVSPDSKSLLFVSTEDKGDVLEIYSLEQPPKPKLSLRPHVGKEPRLGSNLAWVNYMADGKSILLMAASDGKHGYDYDVYRLELETGATERLTNGNGYATDLRAFADGKTAVFLKWQSDWHRTPVSSELYLLDLQTHKLTPFKVSGLN